MTQNDCIHCYTTPNSGKQRCRLDNKNVTGKDCKCEKYAERGSIRMPKEVMDLLMFPAFVGCVSDYNRY